MMNKAIHYITMLFVAGVLGSSCSDKWDDHYSNGESEINNESIEIVNKSLIDYLASESSINSTYQLLGETGMIDELQSRSQLYTVIAVDGDVRAVRNEGDEELLYMAQTYISDVSLSPSNITDGQRILMWNGKYLNVGLAENGTGASVITFNNATVTRVIKLNDGYLYIVDQPINSPRSMYEIIQGLGADYSIFRDMVLSKNENVFDRTASTPVGVDNQGRTVYDSVFTVRSSYFEKDGFDLLSENTQATVFIPSNEVINEALTTARANLQAWGLEREDSVLQNWFIQSTFYSGIYERSALEDPENIDLYSIFDKQWRTTVQQLDLDNPVSMSNGRAYYVTKMKIPTNVLIYRLKDFYYYYDNLTAEEKATYFKTTNLTYTSTKDNGSHTGWPAAGFPAISYKVVQFGLEDKANQSYVLEFTPFKYRETGATTHATEVYLVPPGTYKVGLGFQQEKNRRLGSIDVYINDQFIGTASESQHTGTTYHFDRNGGGYPEGYSSSAASKAGVSKSSNYGRDGGQLGTFTVTGDEAVPMVIRFEGSGSKLDRAYLFHWCLKPTEDCY